ncbi:MAG: hypothetical protein FWB73_05255 [Treponema sp.]|nr:hypothetical protein [Treponema sp.]
MGVIKTALEIAMEKTENVSGDKSSIDQFEMKQKGKKLANAFLSAENGMNEADLLKEIKNASAQQQESLKQGIAEVLIAQIILPESKEGVSRLEKTGQGITVVIDPAKKNAFSAMFNQLLQIVSQYLEEKVQYEQAILQQYAPKLRQKEEEVARRIGRAVHIDPMQDPEFVAFHNQHMAALKNNYAPVIEQAREEVKKLRN